MPGPDPDGVYISEHIEGRISVTHESYLWSNSSHNRFRRAVTILRRLHRGTWRCAWCWGELQTWRRADAIFCCEGCRKQAARQRRLWRVDY
jgi:hypothetical protein